MHPDGWGSAPLARLRDAQLALRSAHATRPVVVEFFDEDIEAPGSGLGAADDDSLASATVAMRAFNDAMRGTNAPIWTIVKPSAIYRGPAGSSESTERPARFEEAFRSLSDESNSSGGAVLLSGGSAAEQLASFQKVGILITSEYRLTFAAPAGAKPHVKVTRDGAHVSAPEKLPQRP